MKTIIPISVEDANTETLKKITKLMVGKFNHTMKIDLYHDRGLEYRDEAANATTINEEIQAVFNLLGKCGQPYYIISTQPNTAQ